MRPETYACSDDGDALILFWSDEHVERIPAPQLRAAARDAASIKRRIESGALSAPADLTIAFIQPMGSMGLNVGFSDGHDRAVYPWDYLRELGRRAEPQTLNVN